MGFEVFSKGSAPLPSVPTVTIQKRGLISMNRAAFNLIGAPEAVELMWDGERKLIGIRPSDPSGPDSYPARPQSSSSDRGPVLVAGNLFTRYIGIDTSVAQRFRPSLEGSVLVIDMNEPGQTVVSNRNRNRNQSPSSAT